MNSRDRHITRQALRLVGMLGGLSAGICAANAQPPGHGAYTMTPAVTQRIVAEVEYPFVVTRYDPPVQVQVTRREESSRATPELAAIAQISAMASQDFAWFRSSWDPPSLSVMDRQDKEQGHDAAFWTGAWAKAFKGTRVELTTRIESGEFVLIAYRLVPPANAATGPFDLVTVLKSLDREWVATQELADDPVLLYWKTPNIRPKRTAREAVKR
jgi:hypothetical protein